MGIVKKIILHVIFPLFLGGIIYTVFRNETLILHSWLDQVGLNSMIDQLRVQIGATNLPEWVLYNLPDGLWAYSMVSAFLILWSGRNVNKVLFVCSVLFFASYEALQAFNIISGTADVLDLAFCIIFGFLSIIIFKKKHESDEK